MKHIDAQAALDNRYLMELIDEIMEMSMINFEGAADDDDRARFKSQVQRATLRLLLDQLRESCRVQT